MNTSEQILISVQTLEALYFLLKSFEAHKERLAMIRATYSEFSKADQSNLLGELAREIDDIRAQAGATAGDDEYRELLVRARRQPGRSYLSKLFIDSSLFSHYEKVFPRWPNIKPHALVVFDGSMPAADLMYILEIEGLLFNDVCLLLGKAREAHKNIEDFRKRTPKDQENLQGYLRAVVTAIFHFIEAYLNGLAYDCFQLHHGQLSIDDHDLLGEWNSDQKRIRYVAFNKKLFTYPVIVAGVEGMQVDLSNCEPANLLATEGKRVRDAFTHPSYYIDPKTGFQERLRFLTGANLSLVELIFKAAKEYVTFVEKSLGRDPRQSAPWLLE
jgi:hypothetical protein